MQKVTFFTALRNARIASSVLATAITSVCLSVTRRYCVKTTARSTVQFAPEQGMGRWVMGQMGHENRMGHMGHGSLGVDP